MTTDTNEEGKYNCPSCDVDFDYEIRVMTTKSIEPMGGRKAEREKL